MQFWKTLFGHSDEDPSAAGAIELMPAEEFRMLVGAVVDEVLLARGWSRRKGLRWHRKAPHEWAGLVFEMQSMRGGVAARWGLHLPAVPRIKSGTVLDLSYDPLDYERRGLLWSLSVLDRQEVIRNDARELMDRAFEPAERMAECCHDLASLLQCYEEKRTRKYLRFGFYSYPQEVLAYAVVLGLVGRRGDGEEELRKALDRAEVTASKKEALKKKVTVIWSQGSLL